MGGPCGLCGNKCFGRCTIALLPCVNHLSKNWRRKMKNGRLIPASLTMALLVTASVFWTGTSASRNIQRTDHLVEPVSSTRCETPSIIAVSESQACTKDSPNFCGFVAPGKGPCGKDGRGPYGSKEECERVNGVSCRPLCGSACPAC